MQYTWRLNDGNEGEKTHTHRKHELKWPVYWAYNNLCAMHLKITLLSEVIINHVCWTDGKKTPKEEWEFVVEWVKIGKTLNSIKLFHFVLSRQSIFAVQSHWISPHSGGFFPVWKLFRYKLRNFRAFHLQPYDTHTHSHTLALTRTH